MKRSQSGLLFNPRAQQKVHLKLYFAKIVWFSLLALAFFFLSYLKSKAKSLSYRCMREAQSLHCLLEDLGSLHHTFLFISASWTSSVFPHGRCWSALYVIRVHLPAQGIDPRSSLWMSIVGNFFLLPQGHHDLEWIHKRRA